VAFGVRDFANYLSSSPGPPVAVYLGADFLAALCDVVEQSQFFGAVIRIDHQEFLRVSWGWGSTAMISVSEQSALARCRPNRQAMQCV
jgi:GTP cyclohydrolase III